MDEKPARPFSGTGRLHSPNLTQAKVGTLPPTTTLVRVEDMPLSRPTGARDRDTLSHNQGGDGETHPLKVTL